MPALVEPTAATQGQPYPNNPICWHWATAADPEASKPRQGEGHREDKIRLVFIEMSAMSG